MNLQVVPACNIMPHEPVQLLQLPNILQEALVAVVKPAA